MKTFMCPPPRSFSPNSAICGHNNAARAACSRRDSRPLTHRDRLSPARLLVRVNAQRQLADDLVGEERVRRVDRTETCVPKELLDTASLENTAAAAQFEGRIHYLPGLLRHHVFQADDFHRPVL